MGATDQPRKAKQKSSNGRNVPYLHLTQHAASSVSKNVPKVLAMGFANGLQLPAVLCRAAGTT